MLKIGEFAALARISIRMLRHYDEMGLLKPAQVDAESGYRYYTLEQLPRLNRILALKDLGLSLEEIRWLLNDSLSADEIRGMFKMKQAQLYRLILDEQARLRRVENRLRDIEHEGRLPENEVVIKPLESLHVISLCDRLKPGQLVPELFRAAWAAMQEHNLAQYMLSYMTIYHHSLEFQRTGRQRQPPGDRITEAVYVVDKCVQESILLPDQRQMNVWDTPPYEQVASLITDRPDQERHLDYQAMWRWMDLHGYRLMAATREIYLKRPTTSDGFLTEILFPIEPVEEESS